MGGEEVGVGWGVGWGGDRGGDNGMMYVEMESEQQIYVL